MLKVLASFGVAAVAGREIIDQGDKKLHTRRASGAKVVPDAEVVPDAGTFKTDAAAAEGTSTPQRDSRLTYIHFPKGGDIRSSFVGGMAREGVAFVPKDLDPKRFHGFTDEHGVQIKITDYEGFQIKEVIIEGPDVNFNHDQTTDLFIWSIELLESQSRESPDYGFIQTDVEFKRPHSSDVYPIGKLVGMHGSSDPKHKDNGKVEYPLSDGKNTEEAYVSLLDIKRVCEASIAKNHGALTMNFGDVAWTAKKVRALLEQSVKEPTKTCILGLKKAQVFSPKMKRLLTHLPEDLRDEDLIYADALVKLAKEQRKLPDEDNLDAEDVKAATAKFELIKMSPLDIKNLFADSILDEDLKIAPAVKVTRLGTRYQLSNAESSTQLKSVAEQHVVDAFDVEDVTRAPAGEIKTFLEAEKSHEMVLVVPKPRA